MGIEVVGVTKRFGAVTAVDEFSLRAEPGELLAVVGPSGCGKTTLLRIIAGLEQADAGDVYIGGRSAGRLPPDKRGVGFVFQQFALFPNMSVEANIAYGLRRRRVPRRERRRRVAAMLAMIGMEGYGGRRPHELSAGQQQRVALARALAPEPRTLLLDEPLSALDAAIRHQLRDELRRVQRQVGITTVLVTHDQEEALAVADRVAVMRHGRLEQAGPPWEVYDRPATRFVAGFIGRGNLLSAHARDDGVWIDGLGLWPRDGAGPAPGEDAGAGPSLDEASAADPSAGPGSAAPAGDLGSGSPPGDDCAPGPAPGEDAGAGPSLGVGPGAGPGAGPSLDEASAADPSAGGVPLPNRPTAVLLRPESIRLVPDSDVGMPASSGFPPREEGFVRRGMVTDIAFGGERTHVRLRIPSAEGTLRCESLVAGRAGRTALPVEHTGLGADRADAAGDGAGESEGSLELLAAAPSGDIPTLRRAKHVRVLIPYSALRKLPD